MGGIGKRQKKALRVAEIFCAAIATVLLIGVLGASTAGAYQDRAEEWVPWNLGEVDSDPCYGNPGETVVWKECESTASWPQFHKWKEGKVTNKLNTLGKLSVGVTEGETLYGYFFYASTTGKFDAWAYTNELPHSFWKDLGVIAWWPNECLEPHGKYNCYWESLLGFWGA